MDIQFIDPFSRGFGRMKQALFQPFNLKKWFVVGFTAFLAHLLNGPGKIGGEHNSGHTRFDIHDIYDVLELPAIAWDWLTRHPIWFTVIVAGTMFLLCLGILLTWISSRGKFMFLDNVVHNKMEIVKPWNNYLVQGNSLFVFRLIYGFVCFVSALSYIALFIFFVAIFYEGYYPRMVPAGILITLGLGFVGMVITMLYISLMMDDFVVPVMYKHKLGILQAWNKFIPLFKEHFLYFLLYGVLMICLVILVIIGVVIAGFMTCCVGFLLIVIPYIGSVVTLPISYTFRAFSLEFFAQFGPEFALFEYPEESAEETQD